MNKKETVRVIEKRPHLNTYRIIENAQGQQKIFLPGQLPELGYTILKHHFHINKMIGSPVHKEGGYIKYICDPNGQEENPMYPGIPARIEPMDKHYPHETKN